ncbi:hypothetical protein ACQPXS_02645 [Streptomyces sp. CA-142005]|uniref:hypothetical protein n=1 Tax=Streptomyces sp. CA-142005 TaxID=3240052 RepID=UPI003D8EF612
MGNGAAEEVGADKLGDDGEDGADAPFRGLFHGSFDPGGGHDEPLGSSGSLAALACIGSIDILAHLKEGDSRLPRRCRVRLRAGSCFIALCRYGYRSYLRSTG